MRLFYQNGGGDAYIVSVGTYGAASGKPITDPAAQVVNPNVKLADLQRGLALLKNEQEPTMYLDLLSPASAPNPQALQILAQIQHPPASPMTNRQLQAALVAASPVYARIMASVTELANILPPSGAMAGVYTVTDNTDGPWRSPANCPITGAVSLPIRLSDSQQATLNIDEATGKSINAIRMFNGQGILVWGARTLDGNSQDWRYIAVRRTMIYLEQSIREAARAYVFQPNDANTWSAVKSMIGSFLTDVWKQGGLQGASPGDTYQVDIGLGVTMTPEDIQNGIMRVSVKVAVQRPAEFIVITFEQQQGTSD